MQMIENKTNTKIDSLTIKAFRSAIPKTWIKTIQQGINLPEKFW